MSDMNCCHSKNFAKGDLQIAKNKLFFFNPLRRGKGPKGKRKERDEFLEKQEEGSEQLERTQWCVHSCLSLLEMSSSGQKWVISVISWAA